MKKTASNIRKNTKNFTRNFTAGWFLAWTVTSTDLVENMTTSITRPTSNMLKTIENTSEAIGSVFKNTAKWNLLHTAGNIVTIAPRVLGTVAEWTVKTLGHGLQYTSGLRQTLGNQLITTWQDIHQTFSTSDESPNIPHKEINLKEPTNLWRDGNHGVLESKEAPKSKFVRWMGNVKNSLVNIPMNIWRIATDSISTIAQRTRWIVESIEWIPKDIKKSRSGVFTKWQSFGTKFWKVFTEGIRWSVKSLGKWIRNIANEWVLKTTVATGAIWANFIGRTLWNTVIPLFSTKAWREQEDNIFEKQSWFQKIKWYYSSTPRGNNISTEKIKSKEEPKQETVKVTPEKIEEKIETKKEEIKEKKIEKSEEIKQEETAKIVEKETIASEVLATIVTGHAAIEELKKAFENKDKKALDEAKDKILKAQATEKIINKDNLSDEHKALFKEIKSTATDIGQLKYKLEEAKVIDIKESNEAMGDYINQEQRKFTKLYNNKEKIKDEDITKRIKSLQKYQKSWGKIVFTGKQKQDWEALSGQLDSIKVENNKVKVWFTTDDGHAHTDEININDVFDSKFSVHAPEAKSIDIIDRQAA